MLVRKNWRRQSVRSFSDSFGQIVCKAETAGDQQRIRAAGLHGCQACNLRIRRPHHGGRCFATGPTCCLGMLGQVSFKSVTANMFVLVQISSELWEYSRSVLTYSAHGARFTLVASQNSCRPLHSWHPGQGMAGRPYWEACAVSSIP